MVSSRWWAGRVAQGARPGHAEEEAEPLAAHRGAQPGKRRTLCLPRGSREPSARGSEQFLCCSFLCATRLSIPSPEGENVMAPAESSCVPETARRGAGPLVTATP